MVPPTLGRLSPSRARLDQSKQRAEHQQHPARLGWARLIHQCRHGLTRSRGAARPAYGRAGRGAAASGVPAEARAWAARRLMPSSAVAAILLAKRLSGDSCRPAQAPATRSEGQALSAKCAFYGKRDRRNAGNISGNHRGREPRQLLKIGQCTGGATLPPVPAPRGLFRSRRYGGHETAPLTHSGHNSPPYSGISRFDAD
jgi:hypothetical protein